MSGSERPRDRPVDRLVWVDCEMTGLDLRADALIEIAVLVTNSNLDVLGDGLDIVIKPPAPALAQMNDVVRKMHTTSGLLDELDAGTTIDDAQEQVLAYVRQWVPEAGKAPLAGNTIATDRGFIARDLPVLDAHLHYRLIDVSSVKELAKRWYPRVYYAAPVKSGGHRAMADIMESLAELRYYRETVFVPLPGPDSGTARASAATHVVSATQTPDGAERSGAGLD